MGNEGFRLVDGADLLLDAPVVHPVLHAADPARRQRLEVDRGAAGHLQPGTGLAFGLRLFGQRPFQHHFGRPLGQSGTPPPPQKKVCLSVSLNKKNVEPKKKTIGCTGTIAKQTRAIERREPFELGVAPGVMRG